MKVIMIRSNPIDPDIRVEKEAETLVKAGYDVTLLGWKRCGDAPKTEKRSGYTITRLNLKAPFGTNVIFYLPFWWILALSRLLREDWDIVHAADLDTYIPALFAAKMKRKPVVYDIYDFYADQVVLPDLMRELVTRIDICLMKFADAIIIVDPSRLRQIRREDVSGVYVIFNSPDENTILSLKEECTTEKEDPSFKIFYAGVFTPDRDFKTILQAAKEIGGIQIEFAGFGQYEGQLRELSRQESFLTFLGTIPYDEVIARTLHADLLFALYNPGVSNNRYASPNKLFEAMMCSKPILVSDGTAMAEIVRKENCGLVVPYGDLAATKSALLSLKNDPALAAHLGENGRKAYEAKYNWKIMEMRLRELYRNIV